MGSDGEPAKPKKRAPHATDTSKAKDDRNDTSGVAVGDAVLVQSAEDKSAYLPATVVRKHMSGEVTVEYTDSGKTEKYVKLERIPSKKRAKSKAQDPVKEGDLVMYRHEQETKNKWRDGEVKVCRKDGTVDVVDAETKDVVKKLAASDVKKKVGDAGSKEEKSQESGDEWEVGDHVEFLDDNNKTWRRGRVEKRRKDGTYDISHESDADEIARKVDKNRTRKEKSKTMREAKKRSDAEDEDDEDEKRHDGISVRKRKLKRKTSEQSDEEEASQGGSGADNKIKDRGRAQHNRRPGVRFEQLRLHQLVEFEDDNGHSHRGHIKLLRKDESACDIEHDSDTDRVSKRVPADSIAPVSMMSRLWGPSRTIQAFPLNSRVYYRIKNGVERKGFVVKIYRGEGKDSSACYDIEDEVEGDVARKVPASKLRPVPWINYPSISMPSLPSLPGLPSMPSMPSWTMLRKGMQVRVRQRDEDSKRVYWQEGVILRLKNDATCVVECIDSEGSKVKVTAKNGDVRPKFTTPFAGVTLPTLQLPQGLHPPKSSVEVLADGKSKVFMGTIVSVNEAEKTYTILYADGQKEKSVASHRVRLCLRKLRIGTEVEMIIEGPCKEVSKLDGEVAWVHRDEKVAVRINGGNNDVFAEVCTHALMVDGQPAFAAPLSSTWIEMGGFYANLALEIVTFLWLCFGLCVEIGEMTRLQEETAPDVLLDSQHMTELYAARQTDWSSCPFKPVNGTHLTIPQSFMLTDRAWLLAAVILKIVFTIVCVGFSLRLVQNKISAIQDNYIDVKEYQRDRVLRRHFAFVMGFTIVVCFFALVIYASLLNRFEFYCLLESETIRFDQLALHVDVFSVHTDYKSTVDLLVTLSAKSLFNLFRAVALHLLVFAFPNAGFFVRLGVWLPISICVTALVSAMGVAALHVFYYVQRAEMVGKGMASLTADVDWAVVAVLVALWFDVTIVRLVSATGAYFDTMQNRQASSRGDVTDDILDQAERGEFGLQAKQEALYSRVELKQEQLGICKLSVLRVQRHLVVHIVSMIIGIIATCTIRGVVAHEASTVHAALTLHLVLCILWLVVVLLASLVAIFVKREAPDLLAYILDV